MRRIAKRWMPAGGRSRQLELELGPTQPKEKSRKQGIAFTLAVAGGVSLITAGAIHRHLILAVAPAAAGLLGCSAALWVTSNNRREIVKAPPELLIQVPSDEKNHHSASIL